MKETPPIRQRFNKVADMTMHEAVTNKRVEGAIERMYEHLHRLNKIRNVGERIIGRRRDEMGR